MKAAFAFAIARVVAAPGEQAGDAPDPDFAVECRSGEQHAVGRQRESAQAVVMRAHALDQGAVGAAVDAQGSVQKADDQRA